jgi:predicted kinase
VADAAPLLVAMCGIPFAGKSTIARELSDRCGMALVSVDAIVIDLALDLGADAGNQRAWARAMAEGFARSRELLAKGESVVYDNANHTRRNRDRCRRVAEQAGARFRLAWIDTPVATARQRLLDNRGSPLRRDVPDASFDEIVARFEPPLDEPDVIRVTLGMTIEDVTQHIA